jgi:putative proteasome-type protease
MTYCIGVTLDTGMIFASDSRTNAGRAILVCVFERRGDRVVVLLSLRHPPSAGRDRR